jgi:hypothetical protein
VRREDEGEYDPNPEYGVELTKCDQWAVKEGGNYANAFKTGCVKTRLPDILPMSRKRDFAFRTPITVIQTVSKTPRDFFRCGQFFSVGRPARWSI